MVVVIDQQMIDDEVAVFTADLPEGEDLDPISDAVLRFALSASAMSLDTAGAGQWAREARNRGATSDQLTEALVLVSGMGVHAYFETAPALAASLEGSLTPEQQALWDRYVGDGKYWATMERHIPGFLSALIRLSPAAFKAFFEYCAVAWRTKNLDAATKELISAACDATPSHRYLPGMRMHLENAIALGVGRRAIHQVMSIAAAGPEPRGVA